MNGWRGMTNFGFRDETLNARKLKASFAVNGTACELYREACEAAHEALASRQRRASEGTHGGRHQSWCRNF